MQQASVYEYCLLIDDTIPLFPSMFEEEMQNDTQPMFTGVGNSSNNNSGYISQATRKYIKFVCNHQLPLSEIQKVKEFDMELYQINGPIEMKFSNCYIEHVDNSEETHILKVVYDDRSTSEVWSGGNLLYL